MSQIFSTYVPRPSLAGDLSLPSRGRSTSYGSSRQIARLFDPTLSDA